MRILHVAAAIAPRYGGPSASLPAMCAALARRDHTVELMTTNVDGRGTLTVPTARPIVTDGFLLTLYPVQRPRYYKPSLSLARALRGRIAEFDVVHVHSLYLFPTLAACHYARRNGVPYVIRPHGTLDAYHRARHRRRKALYDALVERRNLGGAAGIHYTSEAERRAAEEADVRGRAFVVPLGIDAPPTTGEHEAQAALLRTYPQLAGRRLVTFLGRLTPKKGIDLLIEAFARVADGHPEAQLVIAGPDEGLATHLVELARRHRLADRVSLLGLVGGDVKAALLRSSDVFALPSADENFGLAAVEAMAAGVPVVLTSGVAIHREVADAAAGLVVARTPAALAEAIDALLGDRTAAREMGANGRTVALARFSWDAVAAHLEDMYDRVVETGDRVRLLRPGEVAGGA